MKRICISKTGFTILELLTVIAIIVIVSAVIYFGLTNKITSADKTASTVAAHDSKNAAAESQVDSLAP